MRLQRLTTEGPKRQRDPKRPRRRRAAPGVRARAPLHVTAAHGAAHGAAARPRARAGVSAMGQQLFIALLPWPCVRMMESGEARVSEAKRGGPRYALHKPAGRVESGGVGFVLVLAAGK